MFAEKKRDMTTFLGLQMSCDDGKTSSKDHQVILGYKDV